MKAIKRADRELEILTYGKQLSMSCTKIYSNKKKYNRAKEKNKRINYY